MTRGSLLLSLVVGLACAPRDVSLGDDETSPTTSESSESESESSESESESSDSTTDEPPACGNGQIDEGEFCDGEDLAGLGCIDGGYEGGVLTCDPTTCNFDFSGCGFLSETCGNRRIDGIEETCDGDELAGQSCVTLGFVAGTLACLPSCLIDPAIECSSACKFDVSDCLVAGEASPCASEADCLASAPFCTADACWDGAEGDPCLDAADCMPSLACIAGECGDGSEGEPCSTDDDCLPSWQQCALGHCHDGGPGSPCASNLDCNLPFFGCAGDVCSTL